MTIPLSFAQRRLWFLSRLAPSSVYNINFGLELTGRADLAALALAVQDVVDRHEPLRTSYPEGPDGPYQSIHTGADARLTIPVVPIEADRLAEAMRELAGHDFDLTTELPISATVFTLGPDRCMLYLVIHHVSCDGGSMPPLLTDLDLAYRARCAGRAPAFEELPVRYQDYTFWQQEVLGSEDDPASLINEQLDYWTKTLDGSAERLELPREGSRRTEPAPPSETVALVVPAALHRRLVELSHRTQSSLFMVVQAALVAVLTRLGAGTDITLGTPVAGRTDQALENLIGFFVNTLVLRTDTTGNPTFEQLIHRIRETDLSAFDNQDLPFERVVEAINPIRSTQHNPLFGLMYSFQGGGPEGALPIRLGDLDAQLRSVGPSSARFELAITVGTAAPGAVEQSAEPELHGVLEFSPDVFSRHTVELLADRLVRFIAGAAAEPGRPILDVPIFSDDELDRIATDWNGAEVPLPAATVPQLFREQARRTPAAIAVDGARAVSYRELDEQSDAVAANLLAAGVRAGQPVAIFLARSAKLLPALLGVLKAGAYYVPLHEQHPAQQLEWVLADTAAAFLIADSATVALQHQAVVLPIDELLTGAGTVAVTEDPRSVAYLMYTSGSTGTPKGIAVSQANLVSLTLDRCWQLRPGDRILLHSAYAFDISDHEIWVALLNGGTVVAAPPGRLAAADYQQIMAESRIDIAHFPAGLFQVLADEAPDCFAGLRQAWVGGDVVSPEAVAGLVARYPDLTVHHLYGPTETTLGVISTVANDLAREGGPLPIGRPLDNTAVHLLDERLRPVGVGCIGELYLGGSQLSLGYLNQAGRTAERFVADPFGTGGRLYRTGDLARWRPDGLLQFHGRTDDQVKIRGFRVEPGQVASTISRLANLDQVSVQVREDAAGDKMLVGYLVGEVDLDRLRTELTAELPDYLIPQAFVLLDEFPLTGNGKIDRRRLPAPELRGAAYLPGRTPEEQLLCELFTEVLGRDRVGIHDDFFALGGHSLLATRLATRIGSVLGRPMSLRMLFEAPTPARLSERLGSFDAQPESGNLLTLRTGEAGSSPLFCVHPATGSSTCYANLLGALPAGLPVYGFQADPEHRPASVEQLATEYLAELRAVQPAGPYRLLGWSFGGLVAFSIAAQLAEAGETVDFLCLLDAYPGPVERTLHSADEVEPEPDRELVEYYTRLGERYRPARYPHDLLFVAGNDRPLDDVEAAWRPHVGRLNSSSIEVAHHRLLDPDAVRLYAPVLSALDSLTSTAERPGDRP